MVSEIRPYAFKCIGAETGTRHESHELARKERVFIGNLRLFGGVMGNQGTFFKENVGGLPQTWRNGAKEMRGRFEQ